jgi:hypothetical protein
MLIFLNVAVKGYGILKPWGKPNCQMEWSLNAGQMYLHIAAKGLNVCSP